MFDDYGRLRSENAFRFKLTSCLALTPPERQAQFCSAGGRFLRLDNRTSKPIYLGANV
jgi:hypothetical protein